MKEFFYIETLGCSKNEVDSQQIAGILEASGYEQTLDAYLADVIIVNTCTFILDAKEQSIEAILELSDLKTEGKAKKLIVTGCMSQRYGEELMMELPEIDAMIGTGNLHRIVEAIRSQKKFMDLSGMNLPYLEDAVRVLPTKKATRYVKIAEGCNKNCSYCIIPSVRGSLRSRSVDAVVKEVAALVEEGAKEIVLIAQDTTRFGADWAGKPQLADLLGRLDALPGRFWIRVFYMYPEGITDKVLAVFEDANHLLPYFDLPVQHANDRVLRDMNRASNQEGIESLVGKIRERLPEAIIRTTFIVGFPGETEEEFEDLNRFVGRVPFDKVGVFPYSPEEGTPAALRADQISEAIKLERKNQLMQTQMEVSAGRVARWLFQEMDAIIEEWDEEDNVMIARTWVDAPEIDGVVILPARSDLQVGDWARIRIVETNEYDMRGEYR